MTQTQITAFKAQSWYSQFRRNFNTLRDGQTDLTEWLEEHSISEPLIQYAFPWYKSPEGEDYWRRIDEEFNR